MQRDWTFQDVLANTSRDYTPQIHDAYICGIEDLFIAITRANLIKPAHLKHASTLMQVCIEQSQNQVINHMAQPLREGIDL